MNTLITPELMKQELQRHWRSYVRFTMNPAWRRGLSQSHRRKLLKQLHLDCKIGDTVRVRYPMGYHP